MDGLSQTGDGVVGTTQAEATQANGVRGQTYATSKAGSGVLGEALTNGIGVSGTSRLGVGVYGKGVTLAGQFDGPVTVNGIVTANGAVSANQGLNATGDINAGNIVVTGDVILSGSDCAEDFLVSQEIEPGSVVVINDRGALQTSSTAYDRRVAGVISGAGSFKPALVIGRHQGMTGPRGPLALSGKVYCKADAGYGAIGVGDLLTTSPTPGSAMKATDPALAFGAVIGKAMGRLESGQGLIPVLVALQ